MSQQPFVQNHRQLTYAGAAVALAAAVARSREINAPECIAVVDAGGNVLAYGRVEGAAVLAMKPSIAKAQTAASLGIATGPIPFEFGVNLATASQGDITNLGGGLPITVDGVVLGAIGVGSGTTEQDLDVAEAGRAALLKALGAK
jgi:uncharacterized protein GlcG (DUF336 family)